MKDLNWLEQRSVDLVREARDDFDADNFNTAKLKLMVAAEFIDDFKLHHGLAASHFYNFLKNRPCSGSDIQHAIQHAEQANDINDMSPDNHLVLGQCYALLFNQTNSETHRQKAIDHYLKCKSLSTAYHGNSRIFLEERLDTLLGEVNGRWN